MGSTPSRYSSLAEQLYFDPDCVDIPRNRFKNPLPKGCKRLDTRSIAESKLDWRNALSATQVRWLTPTESALLDRVIELEQLTLRTVRAETLQRESQQQKKKSSAQASVKDAGAAQDSAPKAAKTRKLRRRASSEERRASGANAGARKSKEPKGDFCDVADLLLSPPNNERYAAFSHFERVSGNTSRIARPRASVPAPASQGLPAIRSTVRLPRASVDHPQLRNAPSLPEIQLLKKPPAARLSLAPSSSSTRGSVSERVVSVKAKVDLSASAPLATRPRFQLQSDD